MTIRRQPALMGRLLASATVVALCTTPAAAQESEGFFQMLGRIILGTGTAKVAIDTPQAVTALEQEDIDQKQPKTMADLFKGVPGVAVAGASARMLGQAFNIRGVGNTEQTASEERIKVTVDGAPKFFEAYRMGSFFGDTELFKRVEVLRGPASSTLYGSGSIGGVVAFTTKDASDFLTDGQDHALRTKLSYADNGDTLGIGLIYAQRAGNAEFLLSLNSSGGDVMQDGSGTDIAGTEHDSKSALVKGKWNFGNDNDQSVTLSFSRTDVDLTQAPVAQTGGAAFIPSFGNADIKTVDDTLTATYRHGFSGNDLLDLTVQFSYTDTSVEKDNFSYGMLCATGTYQVLCDSSYAYKTTALKVENTADLSYGAWENYLTFGVQLSEQKRLATTTVGAMGFHPEGTDRKLGLYVQGEFTWNEKLTLIPGLRVDFADRSSPGVSNSSDSAVSPKLSAMYAINDNFSIFGTLARTERMPTLDELYSTEPEIYSSRTGLYSAERLASLGLEKEAADTVEIGFTYKATDLISAEDSLNLKATAFHNDIENLIATTTRPTSTTAGITPVPYFSNIRNAEIWGAELEAAYDAERWFASLAWSSVKSKDKSTGLQLPDTPAENVALTLGAKFPNQNLVVGWRGYYFDKITNYSAGSTAVNTTTSGTSFSTHDLFLTWKPQEGALAGFEVNLSVENIFDDTYRNNLALDNGPGRNAKLSVAKTFTW